MAQAGSRPRCANPAAYFPSKNLDPSHAAGVHHRSPSLLLLIASSRRLLHHPRLRQPNRRTHSRHRHHAHHSYDVTEPVPDTSKTYAGHIKFATEPDGQYTRLGFWPADNTFTHSCSSRTHFCIAFFRLMAPASCPPKSGGREFDRGRIHQTLPRRKITVRGCAPETIPRAPRCAISATRTPPRRRTGESQSRHRTRNRQRRSPHWTDHDTDAEGYLIEMADDERPGFYRRRRRPKHQLFRLVHASPLQRKGTFLASTSATPQILITEKTGPESRGCPPHDSKIKI